MFSQLFPSKDATLYSAYPITNTGLDPILEFTKPDLYNASRILIQFDQTEIMNTLSNITATSTSSGSWEAYLRIYASQVESLPTSVPIIVNPISQEWDQLQKIRGFIEEVQSNVSIQKVNEDYANWLVWAKGEVDQRDAVKLAEEGELLPGQGEPDREDFRVAYDWNDENEDEESQE